MSFIKSIKNALGGSSDDEYDVFGQPTTFVNPFSKDKNVHDQERVNDDVHIEVDKTEEYAIDAEFADKAARLMNEHTQAVIAMLKGNWKKEREELMQKVEDANKLVEENKEKMQVNEARRKAVESGQDALAEQLKKSEDWLKLLEHRLTVAGMRPIDEWYSNYKQED